MAGNDNNNGGGTQQQVDVKAIVAEAIGEAMKGVTASLGEALKPIVENQRILADTLTKLPPAGAAPANDAGGKDKKDGAAAATLASLTEEQLTKLVDDRAGKLVEDRLKASQQTAEAAAARKTFIADKLKGLPAVYQEKLGNDPSKWATEEQAIRQQLKDDYAALGVKLPDVGGDKAPQGQPAANGGAQGGGQGGFLKMAGASPS